MASGGAGRRALFSSGVAGREEEFSAPALFRRTRTLFTYVCRVELYVRAGALSWPVANRQRGLRVKSQLPA